MTSYSFEFVAETNVCQKKKAEDNKNKTVKNEDRRMGMRSTSSNQKVYISMYKDKMETETIVGNGN